MSQNHTPGEWLVNPFLAQVEVAGQDAPICAMLWPTSLRSEAETFANAQLIAAAKDMLAALEWLCEQMVAEQNAGVSGFEDWLEPARVAISKAKASSS